MSISQPAFNLEISLMGNFDKGGFFSESVIRFSNLQKKNIPKNYPELEI